MTLQKFDFDYLYNQYLPRLRPDSPFIATPYVNTSIRTLTYEGCKEAVGTSAQYYTRQDVYDRVLLWRIPLVALWATTTLPALRWHTLIFTLVHLIADPIDTFWSLLYKLDIATRNARWARDTDNDPDLHPKFTFLADGDAHNDGDDPSPLTRRQTTIGNQADRATLLKQKLEDRDKHILQYYQDVIALVVVAYDEWGLGLEALKAMNYDFHSTRWSVSQRAELRDRCASAAFYIAADRVSRFLPSVISTVVFISQVGAGFWKTLNALGDDYEDSNPVSRGLNRAPHNIAFGALFFWLPLAVLMTAFVGGSQTSHLVPRVLERFQSDVLKFHEGQHAKIKYDSNFEGQHAKIKYDPNFESPDFPDLDGISSQRWAYGGLPIWQTAKFRKAGGVSPAFERLQHDIQQKQRSRIPGLTISVLIVMIPTACAMAISWLTPTRGFGCRAITQLGFFLSWVVNLILDWLFFTLLSGHENEDGPNQRIDALKKLRRVYWITFVKDIVFASGTAVLLTFTALGIFNNCDCWCKWTGKVRYISYPQEPYIFNEIKYQLSHAYLYFVGVALLSQIILFIVIAIYLKEGWRVLKQRDIDAVLEEPNIITRAWRYCWRKLTGERSMKRANTFDIANTDRLENVTLPMLTVGPSLTEEAGDK